MAKIAVDIDSTLYDFETPARDAFMKLARKPKWSWDIRPDYQRGAYHPWQEWRSPVDACGPEAFLQVIDILHSEEMIRSRVPFPGAVETCQALVDAGHALHYISERDPNCVQPTLSWLAKSGFPSGHPHSLSCVRGDKRELIHDCEFLIDDRPKTVVEFVYDMLWHYRNGPKQRKAFVKAYPYNQNLSDIPNVYVAPTWDSIRFYLDKKGVL